MVSFIFSTANIYTSVYYIEFHGVYILRHGKKVSFFYYIIINKKLISKSIIFS
jgi:hypothetical protein